MLRHWKKSDARQAGRLGLAAPRARAGWCGPGKGNEHELSILWLQVASSYGMLAAI
jgi:hypothetical protein